jgi:carbamoyl-phosphate synthase small subunit
VIREAPTLPSNFRAEISLQDWLARHGIIGIAGVDTRMLTKRLRNRGHENILISHFKPGNAPDIAALSVKLLQTESMSGKELALTVTAKAPHNWSEGRFVLGVGYSKPKFLPHHVVVVDYGVKHTILRCLVDVGCRLTVVPGNTSAEEILAYKPDGILLSNGPGDPAATGVYALPVIKKLLSQPDLPIFGICLGHQLLALALGCETEKMVLGHRGCNHPVQDLRSKRVMITSQNHGFVVAEKALPPVIDITHRSLFDGTIQGIRHRNQPVFSVQGHPEASPGPHDSFYLFKEFAAMLAEANR